TSEGDSIHKTQLGIGIGTPLYAAPEQMTGQPVGPSAALYSRGVILFEMLTGDTPFRSSSASDLFGEKVHGLSPEQWATRLPGESAELIDLIVALLSSQSEAPP